VLQLGHSYLGALNLTELVILGGGSVAIEADGNITIGSITGVAGDITLTSKTGGISIASLAAAGNVVLSAVAGAISLGSSGNTVEMDSLSVVAKDAISIYELNDLRIDRLQSTDGDAVMVQAGGKLVVDGAITALGASTIALRTTAGALELNQAISSASGAITLQSASHMVLETTGDVLSTSGAITLTSGGRLDMTGETEINAGSGVLSLSAAGDIKLGKLRTTNAADLVITSGAIVDVAEGSIDIIAQTAKLVIQAQGGVGSVANPIEIDVAALDLRNTGSGEIGLIEAGPLTITRLEQSSTGAVSLSTVNGAITVQGAVTATTGAINLYAGGANGTLVLNADVVSVGGNVELTADNGDLNLAAGIRGINVNVNLPKGSLVNAGTLTQVNNGLVGTTATYKDNWLTVGPSGNPTGYHPEIEWIMSRGYYVTETATGKVTVANLPSYLEAAHLPNGVILRQAYGPFIKASGGTASDGLVQIAVKGTIGKAVTGFRLSPESVMLNAKTLNASSSDRGSMYLLASDTMLVKSVGAEITATGSQGGETIIATLNGSLAMSGAIDAAGELVNLAGYDVDVRAAVRSPDGALNLTNLNTSGAMVFGANVNGQYSVDTNELGFLDPGFSAINIGSSYGSNQIAFGTTTSNTAIVFKDDVNVSNPVVGGSITLNQSVSVSGNLKIKGSGFTTYWSQAAVVSASDSMLIDDSLIITGAVTAVAGSDGTGNMVLGGQSWHIINGDGQANGAGQTVGDSLTLKAPGNIVIAGRIGFAEPGQTLYPQDPMEGLSVQGIEVSPGVFNLPDDVSFMGEIILHGDLTIHASGTVRFAEAVNIVGGNLTVLGAERVIFESGLSVKSASGAGGHGGQHPGWRGHLVDGARCRSGFPCRGRTAQSALSGWRRGRTSTAHVDAHASTSLTLAAALRCESLLAVVATGGR
jgi:hypothetical protein